jgi:formiminotetrahydrofolate cyclodeaminase
VSEPSALDLRAMTVGEYLDRLASATPVPGDGAVAGITLAQANALGAMVVGYAVGKPKFAAHDAAHRAALARFEAGRARAIELAENDARAYGALNRLWKLPKEDPARAGFDDAVRAAIAAPEATLTLAAETVEALGVLVGTTSASLASDLRIAFDLAVAAADAAIENVRINTPSLADRTEAAAITARTEAALEALRTQSGANRARVS